jgi:hypothetical protein
MVRTALKDTCNGKLVLRAELRVCDPKCNFLKPAKIFQAAMTITQYLGNGATSRGRLDITPQLNTRVNTQPYLRDAGDKEAMIKGIDYIRSVLSGVSGLTWITPTTSQTTTAFVNSVSLTMLTHPIRIALETFY